jgi:cell division protein FtsL
MLRVINMVLMLLTLASVFALYVIKYDARQLETRVHMQERDLDRLQNDVAVLVAERTHLSRPEALEPMARRLGFAPITPKQYLRTDVQATPTATR